MRISANRCILTRLRGVQDDQMCTFMHNCAHLVSLGPSVSKYDLLFIEESDSLGGITLNPASHDLRGHSRGPK